MTKIRDADDTNFERAARNREIVAKKLYIEAYLEIEGAVRRTPLYLPLNKRIPVGELPYCTWRELRGRLGAELPVHLEPEPILVDETDLTDFCGDVV